MKLTNTSEITQIKSESNYTVIHSADGNKITSSYTLKTFVPELLENGFKRIHKSYLVNEKFIAKKNQTKYLQEFFNSLTFQTAWKKVLIVTAFLSIIVNYRISAQNPYFPQQTPDGLPDLLWPLENGKSYYRNYTNNLYFRYGSNWLEGSSYLCGTERKSHNGWDIHADEVQFSTTLPKREVLELIKGKKVYASWNGTIVAKGEAGTGFAQYIIVEHKYNDTFFTSSYLHVNYLQDLTIGQHVESGDILGSVADLYQYDHLHFNVRKGRYDTITHRGALPKDDLSGNDTTSCSTDKVFPEMFVNPGNVHYTDAFINSGQTTYAGNASSPQNVHIIYKIPEWARNRTYSSNSITKVKVGSVESGYAVSKFSNLQNGYYSFELDLPNGQSSWTNGQTEDISFEIEAGENDLTVLGSQQVKFSNGEFDDTDNKWFEDYTRRAALYGFLGGYENNFGNDFSNVDFATAARLVVNASIKLRIASNDDAYMTNAFAETLDSNIPIIDQSYSFFQILKHWGYEIPSIAPQTPIKIDELTQMIKVGFGISNSTVNTLINAINQTPSSTCFFSDNLLKDKYVLKRFNDNISKPYIEPIMSCKMLNETNVSRATLAKLLVNAYEFKYQYNFSIVPLTNARIKSTTSKVDFQILGLKKEFQSTPSGSQIPTTTVSSTTMSPGQTKTFVWGDALDVTIDGQPISCYWSVDGGTLEMFGGAPYFQSVKWTAPNVSATTTFHLYQYASTAGGYAREFVKEIVVEAEPTENNKIRIHPEGYDYEICEGTSTTLHHDNRCTGTITWKTGNSILGTGTSISISPSETKKYHAICTISSGSNTSNFIEIEVIPYPNAPIIGANPDTVDIGIQSHLFVDESDCDGGKGELKWDGLGVGYHFYVTPSSTTTYKVLCDIKGCESPKSETTVTVKTDCVLPNVQITGHHTIDLGETGTVYFDVLEGTLPIDIEVDGQMYNITGSSIGLSKSPVVSTRYVISKISNRCGDGTWSNTRHEGQANLYVNSPCRRNDSDMFVDSRFICEGDVADFTATGCNGIYKWYLNEYATYGESVLSYSDKYDSPPTYVETEYHVSCTDANGCESERRSTRSRPQPIYDYPNLTATPNESFAGQEVIIKKNAENPNCTGLLSWYLDGNLIEEKIKTFRINPLETTTYEAECVTEVGGSECVGQKSAITVYVIECENGQAIISGPTAILKGESAEIRIDYSGTLPYSFQLNGILYSDIDETPYLINVQPNITTSYTLSNLTNPCGGGTVGSSATIQVIQDVITPPAINVNVSQICVGQSIVLTASNCTGTVTWSGGLGSGTSKTITPSSTQTYSAYCSANGANSGNSNEITVIVNDIPPAPTSNGGENCGTGAITLYATGCSGTYEWYDTGSGGTLLSSTSSLITPVISSNRTYYVQCSLSGCISSRTAVSATIKPIPSPPILSSTYSTINLGESVALSASSCSGTVQWSHSLGTGLSKTVSPTINTVYTATCLVNGCVSLSSSINIQVNQGCQKPDLIIEDIIVTKYTTDKIFYAVKVKNVGSQTVDMGSFSFSTYGSSNNSKDISDVFKHTFFLGGGNLPVNQTIIYNVSASMDYKTNQHYFILVADTYDLINECDENNNIGSKLVVPCTHLSHIPITGTYGPGLVAANGPLDLSNLNINPNTVFIGSSIKGLPKLDASKNNISFTIGTCADEGINQINEIKFSEKALFEFSETNSSNEIIYVLNQKTNLNISIWDMEAQAKLKDVEFKENLNPGMYTLDLSNEELNKHKKYIIHFETTNGHWAKLLE